jgi:protein-ribulosamine 3-kinase
MIPASLENYFKQQFHILEAEPLSGGCINECYKLVTDKGAFFIKYNSAKKYPGMFTSEAHGLQLMHATKTVPVPQVYQTGETEGLSFLLSEFVEGGHARPDTMESFGRKLAQMHQSSWSHFGLDGNNYIGSLPQDNSPRDKWSDFFTDARLKPMIKSAVSKQLLSVKDEQDFDRLFAKLPILFTEEKPSLLHGDLWSGNFLINSQGEAIIMDPAVYYGHREMDIAMSMLFGSFGEGFYNGYQEIFPLPAGWEQRIELWNIYPLLVHVNLFGGGYVGQLRSALRRYL